MALNLKTAAPSNNATGERQDIPKGTVAFVQMKVTPYNLQEGQILTPSKNGSGKYLDLELTILGGWGDGESHPFAGRKLWHKLNLVNDNPKAVEIALENFRRLLEVAVNAYEDESQLDHFADADEPQGEGKLWDLDGTVAAIEVGDTRAYAKRDGSQGKSTEVGSFISPNPEMQRTKSWTRLTEEKYLPASQSQPSQGFARPATQPQASAPAAQPAPQNQAPAKPAFLG